MKRGWKIILIIVVAALVLGGLSVGVGMMTGADMDRIYSVMDNRYHISMYWQYVIEVMDSLETQLV